MESFKKKVKKEKVDLKRRMVNEALGIGLVTLAAGIPLIIKKDLEKDPRHSEKGDFFKEVENNEELLKEISFLKEQIKEIEISPEAEKASLAILKYYNILKKFKNFLPTEIFNEAFFMAVMQKESSFRHDAVSSSDAMGIMQTKEIAIRDNIESLNLFKKNNPSLFQDDLPQSINEETAKEVLELIKKSALLGEVAGKLYFAVLFNRYGVGQAEFQKGDFIEAQKKILASYNLGAGHVKRYGIDEANNYYEKILKYQGNIQEQLDRGLSSQEIISNFKKG